MSRPQKPLDYFHCGLPWLCVLVQGRGTGRKLGVLRAWFYADASPAENVQPVSCRRQPRHEQPSAASVIQESGAGLLGPALPD
jgi:hypothetical protein